jgi:hypothetical protein
MKIYIEPLRHPESIQNLLEEHGWRLDRMRDGYTAQHLAVRDEAAARHSLQALGLLTSASVRIEFPPQTGS